MTVSWFLGLGSGRYRYGNRLRQAFDFTSKHLAGRTPFEAWNNIDPYRHPPKEVHYVTAWDGLLTGYCLRY